MFLEQIPNIPDSVVVFSGIVLSKRRSNKENFSEWIGRDWTSGSERYWRAHTREYIIFQTTKLNLQNNCFFMQKIILQKIIAFAKILWPGLVVLYCRYHCFHDIRDPLFCLSILIQTGKGALFISPKTLLWYALKHSSIFSMIHIAAENRLTYDFWEKRCHVWAGISYSTRVFQLAFDKFNRCSH